MNLGPGEDHPLAPEVTAMRTSTASNVRLISSVLAVSTVVAASLGCSSSGGSLPTAPASAPSENPDGGATDNEPGPISTDGFEPTKGLAIKEVAVFQGPKVSVALDGAKVDGRKAPVVAGRAGILRVYVEPSGDWAPREVVATLTLDGGGGAKTLTDRKTIAGPSTDADLNSTFVFPIAEDLLAPDTTYSVKLETPPGQTSTGPSDRAQYPAAGAESLDAQSTGPALQVRIVPIQYNADGSGRLPDTSPEQLERYRRRFQQLYPARKVEITVRDQIFPWNNPVNPTDGNSINNLLRAVINLRVSDRPPRGVYYYGAVTPAASAAQFCARGCVAGVSPLAQRPQDTWTAASVGLGFTGDASTTTATHEVGHGHGQQHSPCAPGGQTLRDADPRYPYPQAGVGGWSWDVEAKRLVDPARQKDFMSYCQPEWVSDWTFGLLATRMSIYGAAAYEIPGPRLRYRIVGVRADGTLEGGEPVETTDAPDGDPHEVEIVGDDGLRRSVTGHYFPFDHTAGGVLVVPTPTLATKRIALPRGILLPRPAALDLSTDRR